MPEMRRAIAAPHGENESRRGSKINKRKLDMRLRAVLFLVCVVALTSCETYLVNTNFYTLQRGVSKQQFIESWQRATDSKQMIGGRPVASQAFRLGDDFWEVWVYNVYRITQNGGVVDHQEYVAFKNNALEEWGIG